MRPMTNWWPMMRIAWRTARRITGSPARPTRRFSAPVKSRRVSSARLTSWPVSIRPQVEALTKTESLVPMCFFQSASPSLSRISLSAVALSGMRSSASATHMSSTPSSLERSYWRMKDSTALCWSARARTRATSSAGAREDELAFGGRERRLGQQIVDGFGFVARPRGGDARAGGLDGGREFGGEDVAQGGVSERGRRLIWGRRGRRVV